MNHKEILKLLLEKAINGGYTCLRGPRPSGALLVTKNGIRIDGNVQPTPGMPSCKDEGECMMEDGHCVRNIHAEVDALLYAASLGIATTGGTMYSINKPCFNCMKACAVAGIEKVIYAYAVYDEKRTNDTAFMAGMELMYVPID